MYSYSREAHSACLYFGLLKRSFPKNANEHRNNLELSSYFRKENKGTRTKTSLNERKRAREEDRSGRSVALKMRDGIPSARQQSVTIFLPVLCYFCRWCHAFWWAGSPVSPLFRRNFFSCIRSAAVSCISEWNAPKPRLFKTYGMVGCRTRFGEPAV